MKKTNHVLICRLPRSLALADKILFVFAARSSENVFNTLLIFLMFKCHEFAQKIIFRFLGLDFIEIGFLGFLKRVFSRKKKSFLGASTEQHNFQQKGGITDRYA